MRRKRPRTSRVHPQPIHERFQNPITAVQARTPTSHRLGGPCTFTFTITITFTDSHMPTTPIKRAKPLLLLPLVFLLSPFLLLPLLPCRPATVNVPDIRSSSHVKARASHRRAGTSHTRTRPQHPDRVLAPRPLLDSIVELAEQPAAKGEHGRGAPDAVASEG